MADVIMPQMGESIVEGTITKWLKKSGDTVSATSHSSKSPPTRWTPKSRRPASGVLQEIRNQEGETVPSTRSSR